MTNANHESNVDPYNNEAINRVYQMLFCDWIERYKTPHIQDQYPWNILFSASPKQADLQKIIENLNLETRPKILAYRKLADMGNPSPDKKLLGMIIEIALDEGLDTLAAYKDGTARYINHSEKLIVWDAPTDASKKLTDALFAEGETIITKIGPWEFARLTAPEKGNARITLLVSHQLYFGEAPINVLFNDPIGKNAMHQATLVLKLITEAAEQKN